MSLVTPAQQVAAGLAVDVLERQPVELVLDRFAQPVHRALDDPGEDVRLRVRQRPRPEVHREHDQQLAVQLAEVDAGRAGRTLDDDVRRVAEQVRARARRGSRCRPRARARPRAASAPCRRARRAGASCRRTSRSSRPGMPMPPPGPNAARRACVPAVASSLLVVLVPGRASRRRRSSPLRRHRCRQRSDRRRRRCRCRRCLQPLTGAPCRRERARAVVPAMVPVEPSDRHDGSLAALAHATIPRPIWESTISA